LENLLHPRQVLRVREGERALADQRRRVVAENALDRRAVVLEDTLAVQNRDDVEGVVREGVEVFFPSEQFGFGVATALPFLRLFDRTAHGGKKAVRGLFEDVIGRTGAQAVNRCLFADGSGDEKERRLRRFLFCQREGLETVVIRQRKIADDQI